MLHCYLHLGKRIAQEKALVSNWCKRRCCWASEVSQEKVLLSNLLDVWKNSYQVKHSIEKTANDYTSTSVIFKRCVSSGGKVQENHRYWNNHYPKGNMRLQKLPVLWDTI